MKTKTALLVGAGLFALYLIGRKARAAKAAPWWASLTGITPGSEQAAMLARQEAEFLGYVGSPAGTGV